MLPCIAMTLALLSQAPCADGACSDTILVKEETVAPGHKYDWHWIDYNGLRFPVWGYEMSPNVIHWDANLKENDDQFKKAADEKIKNPGTRANDIKKSKEAEEEIERDAGEALRPAPGAPKALSKHKLPNGKLAFNYGIDVERLSQRTDPESYRPASIEGRKFMRPGESDETANKLHLTVIGEPGQRKPVMNDLSNNGKLTQLADRLLVQEYSPGNWAIDPSLGFDNKGAPAILVQEKNGKVVAKMKDYKDGPDALAAAIRKADPNYDPKKDPTPAPPGGPALRGILREPSLGLVVLIALLLIPSKKKVV